MKWYVASFQHYFSNRLVWEIAKTKDELVTRITFCQIQRAKFQCVEAKNEAKALRKAGASKDDVRYWLRADKI